MDPALVGAIAGAAVAGILTAVGSLLVVLIQRSQSIKDRHQEAHLAAAAEAISALQQLNRELINVARDSSSDKANARNEFWDDFHKATIRWNTARHVAALYCTQAEIDLLNELDAETDKLLALAMGQTWHSRKFRPHRESLGRLAADFLLMARLGSGQLAVALPSLWPWDGQPITMIEKESPSQS